MELLIRGPSHVCVPSWSRLRNPPEPHRLLTFFACYLEPAVLSLPPPFWFFTGFIRSPTPAQLCSVVQKIASWQATLVATSIMAMVWFYAAFVTYAGGLLCFRSVIRRAAWDHLPLHFLNRSPLYLFSLELWDYLSSASPPFHQFVAASVSFLFTLVCIKNSGRHTLTACVCVYTCCTFTPTLWTFLQHIVSTRRPQSCVLYFYANVYCRCDVCFSSSSPDFGTLCAAVRCLSSVCHVGYTQSSTYLKKKTLHKFAKLSNCLCISVHMC